MAPKAHYQVQGARETRRALRDLGADLRDLTAIHRRIADLVVPVAQANVPNRSGRSTGRLAASIRPRATRTKAYLASRLPYAPVIEYGWPGRNLAPAEYVDRALVATEGQVLEAYQAGIADILKRYGPA